MLKTLSDVFRHVIQLGYVTEDLDEAVDYFQSTLGTAKCVKSYASSLGGRVVVDGVAVDEWVINVALVNAGATNLELIQPVSGAVDLYRNAIRPGAPATFHHLGVRVTDFDDATSLLKANGKSWAQFGHIDGSVKFGYVDMTAELGHYVEVMQLYPGLESYFAHLEAVSNTERSE